MGAYKFIDIFRPDKVAYLSCLIEKKKNKISTVENHEIQFLLVLI